MPDTLNAFPHDLVVFPNGSASVRPRESAEAMHSAIGPWAEACAVYLAQSGLDAKLSLAGEPLIIYDLGMGIAANALAAVECFLNARPQRDLRILSFEKTLDGLHLAMENLDRFPFLEKHHEALRSLLETGQWCMEARGGEAAGGGTGVIGTAEEKGGHRVYWELHEGDFMKQDLRALPPADLVFFDFYSPKACPELWGFCAFEKVRQACAPGSVLITYSAATSVRAAMLLAGFHVGAGAATDLKRETTLAAVTLGELTRPLGADWLMKLERSGRALPEDWVGMGAHAGDGGAHAVDAGRSEAIARIGKSTQFRR
jgi:queuine tRNA-ribosyltransferase